MITVTCDINANIKPLKKLEREGKIELYAIAIEGMERNRKISADRKQLPVAVFDSPFSTLDNCVIASDHSNYSEIQKVIGRHHHGDVVHLEGHIASKRDVFVTDDNDFLTVREALQDRFEVKIMTVAEIVATFEEEAT
jgi:predicted nucleic acid-binding protein